MEKCAMDYAIGIELGGSSVKAVAITTSGEIVQRANQDFDVSEQFDWAKTIKQVFERLQKEQWKDASCLGLGAPGLASRDHKSIAFMPGRLHGLEGLNWTDYLGSNKI